MQNLSSCHPLNRSWSSLIGLLFSLLTQLDQCVSAGIDPTQFTHSKEWYACPFILLEHCPQVSSDPGGGGTQLSFWYRCAARRAANGGLKNGQA